MISLNEIEDVKIHNLGSHGLQIGGPNLPFARKVGRGRPTFGLLLQIICLIFRGLLLPHPPTCNYLTEAESNKKNILCR